MMKRREFISLLRGAAPSISSWREAMSFAVISALASNP
jgi:hypothetical protein